MTSTTTTGSTTTTTTTRTTTTRTTTTRSERGKTVGIVAIGNELLSGKIRDANLHWLAGELRQLGAPLRLALVVPDEPRQIAQAIQWARERVDVVLTCGGVGPTHDDVTLAGLALAFDRPLRRDPGLAAMIEEHYGTATNADVLRMAEVPEGTELLWPVPFVVPIYRVENVHAFPGVPGALQLLFRAWAEALRQQPFHLARLELDVDEGEIAPLLRRAQEGCAAVEIGSYPRCDGEVDYRVLVTVEGKDRSAVLAALDLLVQDLVLGFGPGAVLRREGPSPPEARSFVT